MDGDEPGSSSWMRRSRRCVWKIQGLFLSWMPVCVAGKRPWVGWLVGSVVEVAPTATFASATAGRYLEETKKNVERKLISATPS